MTILDSEISEIDGGAVAVAVASQTGTTTTPHAVTAGRSHSRGGRPTDPPETTEQLLRTRCRLPDGDPDRERLRARAIQDNLPLASRLARRYAGRGESIEDLTQVAALALVKAVDGYDSQRQTPFVGYAVPTIVGALKRHFRDASWGIRVPRSLQELVLEIRAASGELTQRCGRSPTPTEFADHLHVAVNDILDALDAARARFPASLDTTHAGTDGFGVVDMIGGLDFGYTGVDDYLTLRSFVAELPEREQRILAMRFYGDMTQAQIAAEIGVSQMQISRLLHQSLARLRARLNDSRPGSASGRIGAIPPTADGSTSGTLTRARVSG